MFEANTSDGLSIKGTTVQGFSEDSITKTIRKNNYNIFSLITEGRIVHTKGVMTKVKTKNSTPTGRINKDTLILRTYLQ